MCNSTKRFCELRYKSFNTELTEQEIKELNKLAKVIIKDKQTYEPPRYARSPWR